MMVTFVLADARESKSDLAKIDMDSVPSVDEIVEIKGADYVVRSRRWRVGRLIASATVSVRAVLETTAQVRTQPPSGTAVP